MKTAGFSNENFDFEPFALLHFVFKYSKLNFDLLNFEPFNIESNRNKFKFALGRTKLWDIYFSYPLRSSILSESLRPTPFQAIPISYFLKIELVTISHSFLNHSCSFESLNYRSLQLNSKHHNFNFTNKSIMNHSKIKLSIIKAAPKLINEPLEIKL